MARRGLMEQDLSRLNVATLHPLSPEVISRQATINIVSGPSVTRTEPKMARRGLMEQDLSRLDVAMLHPLSPEVISRQATINIGELLPPKEATGGEDKGSERASRVSKLAKGERS